MKFPVKSASAGMLSAALITSVMGGSLVGAATPPAAPTDAQKVAALAASDASYASRIATFRANGLTDAQILALLADPRAGVSFSTSTTTSSNVKLTDTAASNSVAVGDGQFATPTASAAASGQQCGWAITNHDGSAYAIRTSRLYLRTDWCWKGGSIKGTPTFEHRSSVTLYGEGAGWRISPSYDGSKGWIGGDYKTEAKADWRLLLCAIPSVGCVQVQSGTAFAKHRVTGVGTVYKDQGGWP